MTTEITIAVQERELDLASTGPVLTVVTERAAATPAADVVLDLRGVQFLDASAIGRLVVLRDTLAASGRALRLTGLNRGPARVLALVGLLEVLAPGA